NPEIQNWREQGGKVVTYSCAYVPEEVFTAAGLVTVRMRAPGSTGTELSDRYLSAINCSFCRHVFNTALQGGYDFAEGAIWASTCDHSRRIYDNWKRVLDTPFTHMMSLPKKTTDVQVGWWQEELEILKEALEKHFGITITDDNLREAIKTHNETRRLLRQLYELRKKDAPPITGTDALAVVVASTAMPKKRFNEMLKELLEELDGAEGITDYRARLMIVGGILDDLAFVKVIEDQGGLVVTDSQCLGTRIFWSDVDEEGDPLTALARWYIQDKPACPRMFDQISNRTEYVRDMVREFRADGIVGERLVFCDFWTVGHFLLSKKIKPETPYLLLDREYNWGGAVGQLKTRAQAFIETIER
ncbi:MAG: 2-hydroxyacyl-CoA dehydratase, partial [bacterium]|nr:2-hydroxyacyl-CoA dehydratase [bacterium]